MECTFLHAKNETEDLYVAGQIHQSEGGLCTFIKIVKFKCLEVTYEDKPWQLVVLKAGEVFECLLLRSS